MLVVAAVGCGGLLLGSTGMAAPLTPEDVKPVEPIRPDQPAPKADAAQPLPAQLNAAAAPAAAAAAPQLPAGVTAKPLNEHGDIRNAFEAITEGALDEGDTFDNIVNRLVDADRDRISKFKDAKPDMTPLRNRVAQLNQIWKQKYGKDFDLDEKLVFGAPGVLAIVEGEINDSATVARHWPVQAAAADAQPAAARQPGNADAKAAEAAKAAGGNVNLDKGRNVAVVQFAASHGLPAVTASMIHELPDIWRFDLPDTVTGQSLHDSLLKHLNDLGDGSQWPADPNEAYRVVSHHMLMALYDVQTPAARPQ
jgi:hypothetical protein